MREVAPRVLDWVRDRRAEFVDFSHALIDIESPSGDDARTTAALQPLGEALAGEGYRVRRLGGGVEHLYARPAGRPSGTPIQLVLGHIDTVWPVGTLAERPAATEDGVMTGPGSYDMKVGLAQLVFAIRALRALDLDPEVAPAILVNADEEIGSRTSRRFIRRLAAVADRALVLEPSAGPAGALKIARKGIGRYKVLAVGRAAHAGLDPEAGASAIVELAQQIGRLHALNDPAAGITVNVGTIEGGLRPNVVAPQAWAEVDVRVPTWEAAEQVDAAIRALAPVTRGVTLEISGGIGRPPMEPSPGSEVLFDWAREAGRAMGIAIEGVAVGGASDGNNASRFTPTLDGLGPVGGGAHAVDEHVVVDRALERAALLAMVLRAPPLGREP